MMLIVPFSTNFIITIIIILAFTTNTVRSDFDMKATLLTHREQHTNHLNKDFIYDHFRRLDHQRIVKLNELITDHERRLHQYGTLRDDEYRTLNFAKERHTKLLSESIKETQERYAELHEAMQSEHTLGLADLDFTRTGL